VSGAGTTGDVGAAKRYGHAADVDVVDSPDDVRGGLDALFVGTEVRDQFEEDRHIPKLASALHLGVAGELVRERESAF
jgi:hypothetical protein